MMEIARGAGLDSFDDLDDNDARRYPCLPLRPR